MESADKSLSMHCDSYMMPLRSDDIRTTYPGNLRYCPYCQKVVHTGKIRWLWFFVFLLIGPLLIYLLYCLFTRGRICKSCKRRIYSPRN